MANTHLTLSSIAALETNRLPPEWQRIILDSDFTECQPLPIDLEDEFQQTNNHLDNLKSFKKALQPWADGKESETGEGFWTSLVENEVSHKAILCMLYYIMDIGEKRVATAAQREAGITAADVYFTLTMVPGSGAFKIFHPVLYQKATDLFKTWKQIGCPKRKRSSLSQSSHTQNSQRSKSRKRGRNSQPVEDEEDNDSEEDDVGLTPHELTKINKALFNLLKSFVKLLKSYPLREAEDAAYNSLQVLADLAKMEPETFSGELDEDKRISEMKSVPELVYRGLDLITTKAHGDEVTMTNNVMKHLLPVLLMYLDENKAVAATNIPRNVQQAKDHAAAFVCHLIKKKPAVSLVSVRTLLQHMCTRVPDKAEYRTKVAEAVITILKSFPAEAYAKFIQWIFKLSKHTKMSSRGFSLDLASVLMAGEERADSMQGELSVFLTHSFLLQLLLARCSDSAPTVRSRAIAYFSTAVSSLQPNVAKAIKDMMTPAVGVAGGPSRPPESRVNPTPVTERTAGLAERENPVYTPISSLHITGERSSIENATGLRNSRLSLENALLNVQQRCEGQPSPLLTVQLTPGVEITLTDGQGVTSMLRRRVSDEKVNVRKAALLALENLVRMNKENINEEDLSLLSERCRDPALSVRKQALQSLANLLHDIPRNKHIQKHFLTGVLPMVLDRESTAMEKCVDILSDVFLVNIVQFDRSLEDTHKMVWELLDYLAGNNGVDLRRYLGKACQQWGKSGKLKSGFINALKSHINTENNEGVWLLLSEVASTAPKFDTTFVLAYWNENARAAPSSEFATVQRVLSVLQHVAEHINKDSISGITADLKQRLMKFDLTTEIISSTVTTLNQLCRALTGSAEVAERITKEWFEDLLKACDAYLSAVILNQNPDEAINEDEVICYLFTLGEICQLCPDKVSKRACMLVQSLITTPMITSADGSSQRSYQDSQNRDSVEVENTSTEHSGAPLSQISSQGQTQCSQPLSQFRGGNMSTRIRAHAFITLGKLCLQQEDLAKKCVAAIARELEVCQDFEVRNNCVVILCDLCVRYSTLVDRYISSISSCLKDECPLIRKQTLTLFTDLLQEDYLKWKGSLFYRFITALVDDVKEISDFAEFCLVHLLMQRHPGMFYQHFVECIFHFNSYDQHPVYNKFGQTEREKKMFSLQGQQHFEKRHRVYKFLLEHMSDDHKFQLSAKLCQDVLAAIVDDVMPFDAQTSALLQDTLIILASKEIKLSSLKSKPQDEVAETEQEMAQVVMNAAKKTLISQVMKRNVIENIVPTITSLKHMLEKHHTPVMKNLMMYLCELMKDYKNEVKDILAMDKQLAKEIEFDLRKFEEEQQREEEQRMEQQRRKSLIQLNNKTPIGSPKTPTGPPSPRTPGRSPRVLPVQSPSAQVNGATGGSPQPSTPLTQHTAGPHLATPARNTSLVQTAILNSCRKKREQVRQLTGQQSTVTPQRVSKSPQIPKTTKKVAFSESTSESDEAVPSTSTEQPPAPANPDFKTPERKPRRRPAAMAHTRAISTPTGNMSLVADFTFHQEDINLSVIPFSPVIHSANTVTNLLQENSKKGQDLEKAGEQRRDIIYMMSPDKPAPPPKQWNIRSPAVLGKENIDLRTDTNGKNAKNRKKSASEGKEGENVNTRKSDTSTTAQKRQTRRSLQQSENTMEGRATRRGCKGVAGASQSDTTSSSENSSVQTGRRRSLRKK